jgi:hypothetical protein
MARIRTIKPEFFRHESLQDLEIDNPGSYCMLVYAGLWTQCDNHGIFPFKPRQLKLDILPFIPFDISITLQLLQDSGFLTKYKADDGKEYGIIPTFLEHQRLSGKEFGEAGSRYPLPHDRNCEATGKQQGSNREAEEKSQNFTNVQEREREKEKERTTPPTPQKAGGETASKSFQQKSRNILTKAQESLFDRFWEAYPKKLSKGQAEKAWKAINPDEQLVANMIATIERARTLDDWKRDNGQFIPYPATWLNSKRWTDDLEIEIDETYDPNAQTRIEMFQTAKMIFECDGEQNFVEYCDSKKLSSKGVMEWISSNSTQL